jgi:hypothetical protein
MRRVSTASVRIASASTGSACCALCPP